MSTIGVTKGTKYSRNRCPCRPCQLSKRKCDQAKPQCSRCRKLNLCCESSVQGRWRIRTSRDPHAQDSVQRSVVEPGSPNTASERTCPSNEPADPACVPDSVQETGRPGTPQSRARRGPPETTQDTRAHYDGDDDAAIAGQDPVDSPSSTREQSPRALVTGIAFEDFFPAAFSASQLDILSESPFPVDFSSIMPDMHMGNPTWSRCPSSPLVAIGRTTATAADDIATASFSGGDAVSDAVAAVLDDILHFPISLTESDRARCRTHLFSLWAYFKFHVAPSLTPFSTRTDNPFLKYLLPRAEKSRDLLIAVLYLAQIVKKRTCSDTDGVEYHFLEGRAGDVIQTLESDTALVPKPLVEGGWTTDMLTTLSTVLVFCMVFIADQDAVRFVHHLEYAVIVCQLMFKILSGDESFLYLAKLLGFMQNSLLFSTAGSINAPDYLSVALEFHDRNSDALREIDGQYADYMHFRDLDMFSGLSASMASALYALGSLIKRKRASLGSGCAADGETVRAFQCDVDGLEVRLRMHLSLLTDQKKGSAATTTTTTTTTTTKQRPPSASLTICLNAYNEAIFWSVWTIFLTDLRDRSPTADPEVRDAAEHVLDACAEIPRQSAVAPLMLFPLAVGGMRATKNVYREFVLNRLLSLRPVGLTDTQSLCTDLENWWQSDKAADSPITFTRNFVF